MYFLQSIRSFLLILFVALSFSSIFLIFQKNDDLIVAYLNVGQGDAIYIETPSGIQILIDAGPDRSVLRELGDIMPFHDRSIDVVIATHPDRDHIGGFPDILKRYDVSLFIEPGVASTIGEYAFIQDDAVQKLIVDRPLQITLGGRGEEVVLNILFPDRDVSGLEKNAASIIVQLVYGEHTFLFTGDSPKSIEKYLVSKYGSALESDVLKLGHHGSKTSSSELFIKTVDPEYAIVSAGADNRYGHPHQEVLDTLLGIEINRTSEGTIIFKSDGTTLTNISE